MTVLVIKAIMTNVAGKTFFFTLKLGIVIHMKLNLQQQYNILSRHVRY